MWASWSAFAFHVASAQADDHRKGLADKHLPAGLMGGHLHDPGEFMVEYKYMNMYMDGNRLGTQRLSDAQAVTVGNGLGTNFGASPTQMTMEMHMLHFMVGWKEDVTLYLMPMLSSLTMDHVRGPMNRRGGGPGSAFTTHNSGFDDTSFGALLRLWSDDSQEVVFNLGASAPTGDLDRVSRAPSAGGPASELPYPMRRGSGTFDARPGITYTNTMPQGSFGLQFQTDLPIGTNNEGYAVGNEYRLSGWYTHLLTDHIALSLRTESLWRDNYRGTDADLNPRVISTARPDFRGGYWFNLGYGAMVLLGDGHLINFEAVQPLYQDVNGIQLETDWLFNVSWSKAF